MSAGYAGSGEGSFVGVRPLTALDVPAVSTILSESPEAPAWSPDSLARLESDGFSAWAAEQDGAVAGFLIGHVAADEFSILVLAVARRFRRRGMASRLLESALEFARISGCRRAYLEVRCSNQPAIGLYTRRGFTPCGKRIRYYRDPTEDALLFSRHTQETTQ